jgi:type I restriction enzyme M protein
MKADGYSLDDKRNLIKENDIPDIITRYHNLSEEKNRKRTDASFLVPFAEIEANEWDLSINRYKQIEYEEVKYAHPKEILQEIEQLDKERMDALTALKELLG